MMVSDEPLSAEELQEMDELLLARFDGREEEAEAADSDEGIVGLSELDGFLTAIVSGPETLVPSQWLPVLWGDFEPEWPDQASAQRFMDLLFRHMNGIAAHLMEEPESFEPLGREVPKGDDKPKAESVQVLGDWCFGYLLAMGMTPEAWQVNDPELEELLAPIMALGGDVGADKLAGPDHETVAKELTAKVPESARRIHAYWLARRQAPARPEPRRAASRVGRNDPCPCGSGRKYKRCCLH